MLENCRPRAVWKYFEEFCSIPHSSGFEEKAAAYVCSCANRLNLEATTDATGNVLIRKNAQGKPSETKPVILQCHLDMVPQKNDTTVHDFNKDPIRPIVEGEWVKAQGTTLGADNGIGVAIALAVLKDTTIVHPPIEALFTVNEERNMAGAFGLTKDFLSGRKMINLDTENDNEICIGCAGGTDIIGTLPIQLENTAEGYIGLSITISGLLGGHSGIEIHLGRGNALKELGELLCMIKKQVPIQISAIRGGTACNAIPREAYAIITILEDTKKDVEKIIRKHTEIRSAHFAENDPAFSIFIEQSKTPSRIFSSAFCNRVLAIISSVPNGVISMSKAVDGIVETSNNLAIIKEHEGTLLFECMARSSSEVALTRQIENISSLLRNNSATVSLESTFPGWQPISQSSLLKTMKQVYVAINGKDPTVVVVHAGLECGVIGKHFPGMEMISCGPTIEFAHSPDERVNIASVERFWKLIVAGLERL